MPPVLIRRLTSINIALLDIDSHNYPNLPLMKLAAYHKARGDHVEWWNGLKHYDLAYKSKVFTDEYSMEDATIIHADQIIQGGTGYNLTNKLPDAVEHIYPDYSMYPQCSDTAYGFLTRGCPRGCLFCIVAEKEGLRSRQVADLTEFWRGQRYIELLDPNLLASREHEHLLERLANSGAWVDFTQGLDIRLTTLDNVRLLDKIKVPTLRFAWDNPEEDLTGYFSRFLGWTEKKKRKRRVYVLTNFGSTHTQDLYRVYTLRNIGFDPYVMVYSKPSAPLITRKLQRWVNNKYIFNSTNNFQEYYRV